MLLNLQFPFFYLQYFLIYFILYFQGLNIMFRVNLAHQHLLFRIRNILKVLLMDHLVFL